MVPPIPTPRAVQMCPPDAFDVVDVKNPFMVGNEGAVDRARARRQWDALRAAFEAAGMPVEVLPPEPDCEDMTFCANPSFPYLDRDGARVCLLGRMRSPSRERETPAVRAWFQAAGYRVVSIPAAYEGGGDTLSHPGRRLLWGGIGPRSEAAAYPIVSRTLDVEVKTLKLATKRFYHLDTCLCLLDEQSALVFEPAFEPAGLDLLRTEFSTLICVSSADADKMACNAVALPHRTVLIPTGCAQTVQQLRDRAFTVVEIDTGEFLKSGGSVFCLKQFLY